MRRALEACTAALELKVQEAVAEQAELAEHPLVSGGLPCGLFRPAGSALHVTPVLSSAYCCMTGRCYMLKRHSGFALYA